MQNNKVLSIPLKQIRPSPIILRLVNKRILDYIELRDSIAEHGILNAVCVRHCKNSSELYELVDGFYRYSIAVDLGAEELPCVLLEDVDDKKLLRLQIEANAIRPETKPSDFANHLRRMIIDDPTLDCDSISVKLHKSPIWVMNMLSLTHLAPDVKKHLDGAEIPLITAYILAKLPIALQLDLLPKALMLTGKEFSEYSIEVVNAYREARRKGQMASRETAWAPQPFLRAFKELKTEYYQLLVGRTTLLDAKAKGTPLTDLQIWEAALAWVLHLDESSVRELTDAHFEKDKQVEHLLLQRRDSRERMKSAEALGVEDVMREFFL